MAVHVAINGFGRMGRRSSRWNAPYVGASLFTAVTFMTVNLIINRSNRHEYD